MGLFSIEGADEFSEYGIPQQYEFDWASAPWLSGLSLRGAVTNPLPNLDTMDPEARNALINSGYDPLQASMTHQPQYSSLDIEKYRVDPFGGYIQAQGKDGKTIYLMGTGKSLSHGVDMMTNYENVGLPVFRDPSVPNEEWRKMDYDPYGANAARKSLYKLAEPVGQGWFSKNMDWLVPAVIGGLGGYAALTGTGAGAAGAAEGLSSIGPAQGSILPAGVQASGAVTFPVANPYAGIEAIGAGAGGGAMANELIYSDIGPAQGSILNPGVQESGAYVTPVDANPYAGITAKPTGTIWDKAKELAGKMPSAPGGGAQMEGGDGGEGMSIWSDTVNPFAFDPVGAYQPKYLDIQQQQFPFEAELQKRLALIRGAR